jgi:hypothetical protein
MREREWWQERNVDPLAIAEVLWRESRLCSTPAPGWLRYSTRKPTRDGGEAY